MTAVIIQHNAEVTTVCSATTGDEETDDEGKIMCNLAELCEQVLSPICIASVVFCFFKALR